MSDAIIVFGGGINQDGTLNPDSKSRVELAVKLWREKAAPVILFCGKWSFNRKDVPARTEAAGMAECAMELGCPRADILTEERSTDTIGNAYFAKTLFAISREWTKLIVVTADYHAPRSKAICQKVFGPEYEIEVVAATSGVTPEKREDLARRDQASQILLEELSKGIRDGDDPAIWHALNTRHPGYSSNPEFSTEELKKMIAERQARLI